MKTNLKAVQVLAMSIFSTAVLTMSSSVSIAEKADGTAAGGGGSFAEQDFAKSGWQMFYRIQRLQISPEDLAVLKSVINKTKPIETEKELIFQGQRKSALNFRNGVVPCQYLYCKDPQQKVAKFSQPVIVFNTNDWKSAQTKDKPYFAYHEYLGILKSDRNNYELSARLAAAESEALERNIQETNVQSVASEETVQIFLNRAGRDLDEINAMIETKQYGQALSKSEKLKAQILIKLGVDPRTGLRSPQIQLYIDGSYNDIDEINYYFSVARRGSQYGIKKYYAKIAQFDLRNPVTCGLSPNSKSELLRDVDEVEDGRAIIKTRTLEHEQKYNGFDRVYKLRYDKWEKVRNSLRSEKYALLLDLVQFQKLFAIAYQKAYVGKFKSNDVVKIKNYLSWVRYFQILVEADHVSLYMPHADVISSDYAHYINNEFRNSIGSDASMGDICSSGGHFIGNN